MEEPVVVVVGAPGHGKSSVGNLILGEERFRVRGRDVLAQESTQVRLVRPGAARPGVACTALH